MLYRSPNIVALDELNGKRRTKRQTGGGERLQTYCTSGSAVFKYSHCTPKDAIAGTTRTFEVWCRERSNRDKGAARPVRVPGNTAGGRQRIKTYDGLHYQRPQAEPGICAENEICIDREIPWTNTPDSAVYKVASCISTRDFKQLPSSNDLSAMARASGDITGWSNEDLAALGMASDSASSSNNQGASSSNQNLAGLSMSVRLSSVDERPLPANVEVDSGRARTNGNGGSITSHPCREPCLEVSTSDFPENTNWVSAHARLVSTLAVAGVMWVALFH